MMPPNKRLQLALPPIGVRPWASNGRVLVASVGMTPAFRRGAAETLTVRRQLRFYLHFLE